MDRTELLRAVRTLRFEEVYGRGRGEGRRRRGRRPSSE